MNLNQPTFDPSRIHAELVKTGEAWADAEAAASLLEETRKSILAKLKNDAPATSDAAKETAALATPEYRDFVAGMVKARATANKARVRYDSAKILAELRRSEQATARAEMQIR